MNTHPSDQPAFPFVPNQQQLIDGKWDQSFEPGDSGLTKREYIAAKAMQGILSNQEFCMKIWADDSGRGTGATAIASNAVSMADAMLAELQKK